MPARASAQRRSRRPTAFADRCFAPPLPDVERTRNRRPAQRRSNRSSAHGDRDPTPACVLPTTGAAARRIGRKSSRRVSRRRPGSLHAVRRADRTASGLLYVTVPVAAHPGRAAPGAAPSYPALVGHAGGRPRRPPAVLRELGRPELRERSRRAGASQLPRRCFYRVGRRPHPRCTCVTPGDDADPRSTERLDWASGRFLDSRARSGSGRARR